MINVKSFLPLVSTHTHFYIERSPAATYFGVNLHLFLLCIPELRTSRIYMREVTLKAYMRSYLVGSMSKVLSDTSSMSILCVCEKQRLLVHL